MCWRLALDMGTNSLGWSAFGLNNSFEVTKLLDAGVRIFSDGREPSSKGRVGESLAVERRLARGARRNRDRRLQRKRALLERLIKLGLMPNEQKARKALECLDPYQLRSEALKRALTPYELGRALFQINQRRGFLSNRKSDSDDDETGKIKPKIKELNKALGTLTLGQWLYERLKTGKSIRFKGEDGDYYADRAMYLFEFDKIHIKQKTYHTLSETDWDDLRNGNKDQGFDGIFYQRKLKPVEKGRCEFFVDQYRAHKDLPSAQQFRILQEIGNLQYYADDHKKFTLNEEQRDLLIATLNNQKTLSFGAIRKFKKQDGTSMFPRGCLFNLETGPRDLLKGNATAFEMRKPELFGDYWDALSVDDQDDILELLHEEEEDAQLVDALQARFQLTDDQAQAVSKFKLSSATTHLSRKFMIRCADIMRDNGLRYDKAVANVWDDDGVLLHHSHRTVDELQSRLPYYGAVLRGSVIGGKPDKYDAHANPEQHFGKINNPTVHIALNQVQKLINRLADRYGPPSEIHIELVRDLKKTAKARNDIAKENTIFAKANKKRADLFKELFKEAVPSGQDLKKIRLWEELGTNQFSRLCPFSGKAISAAMLFNGEAEIEHILPFSRTLDNGTANLTVSTRQSNRVKGNKTPYEAFGSNNHADKGMVWSEISGRAKLLPKNKRWRFDVDAMDHFEKDGGFLARQLTDTAYISRVTKRYLGHICDQNKIVTVPGGLTAMMRGKWHLNSLIGDHNFKERNDHRHHIIDAFVVGLTDRKNLIAVSRQTSRGADDRIHIKLPDITLLRNQLKARLQNIVVSYKPDHGTNGKMFNETAYGIIPYEKQDPDLKGYSLVTRKKIDALSEKEISAIRNPGWRSLVQASLTRAKADGIKLDQNGLAKLLGEFGKDHNIKTIRILVSNQSSTIISSAPFKAYTPSSFVCVDIWQVPKGKPGNWKAGQYNWVGVFWSYAQCRGKAPNKNNGLISGKPIHPAAKHMTRLFKDDLVSLGEENNERIMRVAGFSTTNNIIDLRPQFQSDSNRLFISINVLQGQGLRRLAVLEDGTVKR